jgi:hypothetical protein
VSSRASPPVVVRLVTPQRKAVEGIAQPYGVLTAVAFQKPPVGSVVFVLRLSSLPKQSDKYEQNNAQLKHQL